MARTRENHYLLGRFIFSSYPFKLMCVATLSKANYQRAKVKLKL